jgi:hypothetical protein
MFEVPLQSETNDTHNYQKHGNKDRQVLSASDFSQEKTIKWVNYDSRNCRQSQRREKWNYYQNCEK